MDALILTNEPIPTGVFLKARVLGVLKFEDDCEVDDKIIVVPTDDRNSDSPKDMEGIHEAWKQKIEHHFSHYKDLKKPGSTIVRGWGGTEEANKVIKESIERWENR